MSLQPFETAAQADHPDYRDIALEQSSDDLIDVAASAALYRELSKIAIEMIVRRDRQIKSLQQQLAAVRREYQVHRERAMWRALASQERALTPRAPGRPGVTRYIPLAARRPNADRPHGADA